MKNHEQVSSIQKLFLSTNLQIKIHRTIILTVVLYAYETWSLTLRKKHRWRVSDSEALTTIFGPNSEEVAGGWRTLNNDERHNV